MAAAHHLQEVTRKTVEGRAKLGVSAFAEALLGIPKILAENSGYDAQVLPALACSAHVQCQVVQRSYESSSIIWYGFHLALLDARV